MFEIRKTGKAPTRVIVLPSHRHSYRAIGKIKGSKGNLSFYAQYWECPEIKGAVSWEVANLAAEEFLRQGIQVRFRNKEETWMRTAKRHGRDHDF